MKHNNIQTSLFVNNRKKFSALLPQKSIAIFVANEAMPRNGDQFFPFRQQSDFYYLTGIETENAYLIIAPDHATKAYREMLFIEPYDEVKATWQGEMLDAETAKEISGIEIIQSSDDFYSVLKDVALNGVEKIFMNTYEYSKYECPVKTIQDRFREKVKEMFPVHQFRRSAPILNQLRLMKSKEELAVIQHACDITGKAFERCLKTVKPGRMEYEIQAEIEYIFKLNNASGHAYAPIIAGGKNACCLHYSKNNDELNDGDLLLFDIGCEYQNYSSDLSRTIPINGKFTERQKECYNAVLRVMKEITKHYKIGSTIDEINKMTYQLMEKEMIRLGLFSEQDVKNQNPASPLYRKYLMHGVSHHIGLDVHDSVDKFTPFQKGMILTCEPGIYIREEGIGIRIENDLLITNEEPQNLFEGLPIEVEEIEQRMKK